MSGARYAVYWAPEPATELARFGAHWLGRDAETGQAASALAPGLPASWERATEEARHYGFHATLKPPFRLRDGYTEAALDAALEALCAELAAIDGVTFRLSALDGFLALVPGSRLPELSDLARRCVIALDEFRAPADAAELARRRAAGLTARQEAMLTRWGYPYVLEEFRFHLTLTRRLSQETGAEIVNFLAPHAEHACAVPLGIASLCLFVQEAPGAAFTVRRRVPVGIRPGTSVSGTTSAR
jgi:putative phosphonate metabolism protein